MSAAKPPARSKQPVGQATAEAAAGQSRYQVLATTPPLLVDTFSGRTWRLDLNPPEGQPAGWRPIQYVRWAPAPPERPRT